MSVLSVSLVAQAPAAQASLSLTTDVSLSFSRFGFLKTRPRNAPGPGERQG